MLTIEHFVCHTIRFGHSVLCPVVLLYHFRRCFSTSFSSVSRPSRSRCPLCPSSPHRGKVLKALPVLLCQRVQERQRPFLNRVTLRRRGWTTPALISTHQVKFTTPPLRGSNDTHTKRGSPPPRTPDTRLVPNPTNPEILPFSQFPQEGNKLNEATKSKKPKR